MTEPIRATGDAYTDLWNAEQLVATYGADLRYTAAGGWYVWTGTHWAPDSTGAAMRRAKATVRNFYAAAAGLESKEAREALVKHAIKSEGQARLEALLASATSEPGIAVEASVFDRDPWALNCRNGTVDLRCGTLRPHRQADLLTHCLPVAYDATARAPRWTAFLDRVLGGDTALISFVQRAVGYSLAGTAREQCLFFCHGPGKNGKSTFMEVLQALAGPLSLKLPMETLLQRRNDSAPPWMLAELAGRRLVVGSEIEEGRKLNEALVKDLTGLDTITAARKYGHPFSFRPAFTLWLYGNHKPALTGTDAGIQRRLRLIPFLQTIAPAERDPALGEKLLAELPGILAWAVAGCRAWLATGLQPPAAVVSATKEYFAEQDILAPFLAACTLPGRRYTCPHKDLYAAYVSWAEENGDRPLSGRVFSDRMKDHGYQSRNGTDHKVVWDGLGLRIAELRSNQSNQSNEVP